MVNNSENDEQQVALMDFEIDKLIGFFIIICSTKAMQYMVVQIKPDE